MPPQPMPSGPMPLSTYTKFLFLATYVKGLMPRLPWRLLESPPTNNNRGNS
jgi:hypothetical protein